MADEEQLALLLKDVSAFNQWREENPYIRLILSETNLSRADLSGANLSRAALGGADLSRADLSEANLRGVDLSGANLSRADLSKADLRWAILSGIDLSKVNLRGANLSGINFSKADLSWERVNRPLLHVPRLRSREADLSGVDLSGVNLSGVNLSGADLSRADLSEASLRGTNLTGANLSRTELSGSNLTEADLTGVELHRTELSGSSLTEADLSEANLRGANLSGANLSRTELFRANLRGINLSGTDLSEANLRGANLTRVSFIDANLNNAVLTDSRLWEIQRAGWSIIGVKCESAFLDREGGEATHYAAGEFERLYADKIKIVLPYEGGINSVEMLTLPALIQLMENEYKGCSLRLQSVQDDAGGATVTLVADDLGQHDIAALRASAEEARQQLQLKLRKSETLRFKLEGKIELMREELFPVMERAMSKSKNTFTGPVNAGQIGDTTISDSGTQTFNQTFNTQDNLDVIKEVISLIQAQRQELTDQLTSEKSKALDDAVCDVETQLGSEAPDDSIVSKALTSVKTILEGASGSVLASGVLVMLGRLV